MMIIIIGAYTHTHCKKKEEKELLLAKSENPIDHRWRASEKPQI